MDCGPVRIGGLPTHRPGELQQMQPWQECTGLFLRSWPVRAGILYRQDQATAALAGLHREFCWLSLHLCIGPAVRHALGDVPCCQVRNVTRGSCRDWQHEGATRPGSCLATVSNLLVHDNRLGGKQCWKEGGLPGQNKHHTPVSPALSSRAMTALILSGRSGWGEPRADSSRCSSMRSS